MPYSKFHLIVIVMEQFRSARARTLTEYANFPFIGSLITGRKNIILVSTL